MSEVRITWPEIVIEPAELVRSVSPDGLIRFRVTQRIRSMSLAGLFPLLTMPVHDEPMPPTWSPATQELLGQLPGWARRHRRLDEVLERHVFEPIDARGLLAARVTGELRELDALDRAAGRDPDGGPLSRESDLWDCMGMPATLTTPAGSAKGVLRVARRRGGFVEAVVATDVRCAERPQDAPTSEEPS